MVLFEIQPILEVAAVTLPSVAIGAIAFYKWGHGRGYRKGREEEHLIETSIREGVSKIIAETSLAISNAADAKTRRIQAAKRAADGASNGGSPQ